jgi:hypothetical protein
MLVSRCLLHYWLLLPYAWLMQIGFMWLFLLQGPPTRSLGRFFSAWGMFMLFGYGILFSFFREYVPFGYLALLLCLLWFVQGRLFPLLVYVLLCWFPACIASLSCYFWSIQFLHLIKKKKINPDQRLNFEPTTPIKGLGHMNEDNTSSEVMRIT